MNEEQSRPAARTPRPPRRRLRRDFGAGRRAGLRAAPPAGQADALAASGPARGIGNPHPCPLPDHLRGELGGGAGRAGPARHCREARQEPVRVDDHRRDCEVGHGAAAEQVRRRQHGRSPFGAGRGDPAGRPGNLPVQGLPPLHDRRSLQPGGHPPIAQRGLPSSRHVQVDRDRVADDADQPGPGQGRDGRRVRLAGAGGFYRPAGPDHRRREGQPAGPDRPRRGGPRAAAARRPGTDAQGGGKRLRQDARAGRPTGGRRRGRGLRREAADHQEERPAGILRDRREALRAWPAWSTSSSGS